MGSTPSSLLTGHAGRYRLGAQLASGGMATIHTAYDALAQRDVAYKRLCVRDERARPRLTALFEREYEALRKLVHPNIVEVYDYGIDPEGSYYTMELLSGKDLTAAAPLPVGESCRILRDVASAIALAHTRRIVHRDITPANVRLTGNGRAKLIDFGALCPFGVANEVVGTPPYVAPECLAGQPLDQRTDLFALGALAYWMLTGRSAFPARALSQLPELWRSAPDAPSTLAADVPRALDELVLALLEREPVARPPSAADVIERLTAIAALPPEENESKVAQSYLKHPPLVGRSLALGTLHTYCKDLADSPGRSVLVEAGPGLGRTALMDEVAVDAQLLGASVFRWRPGEKLPRSLVRWLDAVAPDLSQAAVAQTPALSSLLARKTRSASKRPTADTTPSAQDHDQGSLLAAIEQLVAALSQRSPVVLLVDDAHRADPDSLALLASIARATPDAHVLVLSSLPLAYRTAGRAPHVDLKAISETITLESLAATDVERLVETIFGRVPNTHRLAHWLYAQSGGNPAQCLDLCRSLLRRKEIRYTVGTFGLPFDLTPADTRDVSKSSFHLARLHGVGTHARRLADLMSLHDRALSLSQLASAAGRTSKEVLEDAAELQAEGIARVVGEDVALASESLRETLRGSVAEERLAPLHLAVAQALLRAGDGTVESTFCACDHLLKAGRNDEAIALVWDILREDRLPYGLVATFVPVLERMLQVLRGRGHPDEHLSPILRPLVIAGFWGDLRTLQRHRETALQALSNLTGMTLAHRLGRYLGGKLALFVGIVSGLIRHVCTPKKLRLPDYPNALLNFISVGSMSIAASAAAFEPAVALRLAAYFDPLRTLPERHPARIAREFCIATAEVGAGRMTSAAARYTWIMEELARPDTAISSARAAHFVDGSIHGRAQADATHGIENRLAMTELLETRDPFFRPHVEFLKMGHHLERGEKDTADHYRRRGEMIALRGGTSWTAVTTMLVRYAYFSMLARDSLGVSCASLECERLAATVPGMGAFPPRCRAYAELAGGRAQEAVECWQAIFANDEARLLPTWPADRTMYAEALHCAGRTDEAKRVCEELLQEHLAEGGSDYILRLPIQQLALIEAALGNLGAARALLARVRAVVVASDSPLSIGTWHRDCARVCMATQDAVGFAEHFDGMQRAFSATHNPALIQQYRQLAIEAERCGLIERSRLGDDAVVDTPIARERPHAEHTVVERAVTEDQPVQATVVER